MAATRTTSESERTTILDAALRVMRRNAYAEAQISDILAEAELSTRAFYRHFESKDDLLMALYRNDAEEVARQLRERVAAAGTPEVQLGAWIDETLSLGYDRRRAKRAAMLASDAARRTAAFADESARAARALSEPLREVLARGASSGAFPRCVPDQDAATIYALVWRLVSEGIGGRATMDADAAAAHVRRFCFPALGIAAVG
ncbi:MAG TPA: TetR/AcrR family transcriptional regulator [Acidimicrobiia bacterium]|nr:TetR/AcrR family transcriptional regulator [Acidimicrobiia bacterium]